PGKTFIPAPPDNGCACNDCPHMKLNTLEKLYLCLKHEQPELVMDEALRRRALAPIERMLAMSEGVRSARYSRKNRAAAIPAGGRGRAGSAGRAPATGGSARRWRAGGGDAPSRTRRGWGA